MTSQMKTHGVAQARNVLAMVGAQGVNFLVG